MCLGWIHATFHEQSLVVFFFWGGVALYSLPQCNQRKWFRHLGDHMEAPNGYLILIPFSMEPQGLCQEEEKQVRQRGQKARPEGLLSLLLEREQLKGS